MSIFCDFTHNSPERSVNTACSVFIIELYKNWNATLIRWPICGIEGKFDHQTRVSGGQILRVCTRNSRVDHEAICFSVDVAAQRVFKCFVYAHHQIKLYFCNDCIIIMRFLDSELNQFNVYEIK